MNNTQVGRSADDAESVEIRSGDVLQFGVDVVENSKKGMNFSRVLPVGPFFITGYYQLIMIKS